MRAFVCLFILAASVFHPAGLALAEFRPVSVKPPGMLREFRGMWVATVFNLDWPSRPGLSPAAQQAELKAMLDRGSAAGLNALILQVRPACDALYDSPYEPWSPYLTGTMGRSPGYDPLAFAVEEAHRRGLELHAWFNPFRAQSNFKNPVSGDHVTKRHPEWVRRYGDYLWLDPGDPDARGYSLKVILDVVKRYDIDGVHIDDYFYPYPYPSNENQRTFPDEETFRKYGKGDRNDWRRANIDRFVENAYSGIKASKPWVKFGVSPFGVWRPGIPAGTTAGLDPYGQMYADSRKWLNAGWCDYFSPQLYWPIASKGQSFPLLLRWWDSENRKGRHVWPGIATERVGRDRKASEMAGQIELTRQIGNGGAGHLHWSAKAFVGNLGGVRELLDGGAYSSRAVVPACAWLGGAAPAKPSCSVSEAGPRLRLDLQPQPGVGFWVLQSRSAGGWSTRLLDGRATKFEIDQADVVAISALGRTGSTSEPLVLGR